MPFFYFLVYRRVYIICKSLPIQPLLAFLISFILLKVRLVQVGLLGHFNSSTWIRVLVFKIWKQIIISTLHCYMHPNIGIGIAKFVPIQGEIEMKRKFSFSFFIPIYQIWPKRFRTVNEVNGLRTFLPLNLRTWSQYDKVSKVMQPLDGCRNLLWFCFGNRVWNDLLLKV